MLHHRVAAAVLLCTLFVWNARAAIDEPLSCQFVEEGQTRYVTVVWSQGIPSLFKDASNNGLSREVTISSGSDSIQYTYWIHRDM